MWTRRCGWLDTSERHPAGRKAVFQVRISRRPLQVRLHHSCARERWPDHPYPGKGLSSGTGAQGRHFSAFNTVARGLACFSIPAERGLLFLRRLLGWAGMRRWEEAEREMHSMPLANVTVEAKHWSPILRCLVSASQQTFRFACLCGFPLLCVRGACARPRVVCTRIRARRGCVASPRVRTEPESPSCCRHHPRGTSQ